MYVHTCCVLTNPPIPSLRCKYFVILHPTNHHRKTYIDTNHDTKLQIQNLAGTNMTFNNGTNKFDVSVPPSYGDSNVRSILSVSAGSNMNWNSTTKTFNVVLPASPLPYTDTDVRTVLSTSASTNMVWKSTTNKLDVSVPS